MSKITKLYYRLQSTNGTASRKLYQHWSCNYLEVFALFLFLVADRGESGALPVVEQDR